MSGTTGLPGGADNVLVLRRIRTRADAVLLVTGRDIEERELALQFDKESFRWSLMGNATEWSVSPQQQKILTLMKGATVPVKPKEIAEAAGLSHDVVKHLLPKMAVNGLIRSDGNGAYTLLRSPRSPDEEIPWSGDGFAVNGPPARSFIRSPDDNLDAILDSIE